MDLGLTDRIVVVTGASKGIGFVGRMGVRVNAINPGGTLTGRVEEGVAAEDGGAAAVI